MKRRTPVWWRWLRARIGGYFWGPCPICGKPYGGHEANKGDLMTSWSGGVMTCPNCAEEAKRRNREFMVDHPVPVVYQADY